MARFPAQLLSAFPRNLIVGVLVLLAGTAVFGWRSAYVPWQLHAAKDKMNLGSQADVQQVLEHLRSLQGIESPDRPELLFLLGRASRRAGLFDDGMDYLSQAEAAGWDLRQIELQRQLARIQTGHIDFDDSAMNQLMQQDSSDAGAYEIYEALAKGYMSSYRFNDAIHCLDFWIDWCPTAVDARIWRAGIREQTSRWEDANKEYLEVLRIKPGHIESRLALARNLLMEQNKVRDAYEQFLICLKQLPDDFHALLGCASCQRQLGEPEAAEQTLRELLTRSLTEQQRANVSAELGLLLVDQGNLTEAAEMLSRTIEIDPLNASALYALGTCWSGLNQKDKALECFERSRILTEQFTRLTNITTELANKPEQPDLRWEAGRILMDHGLHTEGAAWMATALIYDPNHQPTHESLAEYYETVKPDEHLARRHRGMVAGSASQTGHVN